MDPSFFNQKDRKKQNRLTPFHPSNMQPGVDVFTEHSDCPKGIKTAVVIGNFDGVHRGHLTLIKAAIASAETRNLVPLVLTFSPHPGRFIAPEKAPPSLMTDDERLATFARLGIRSVCLQNFNGKFSRTSPQHFVDQVLMEDLGAQHVAVGFDFRFGYKRRGDIELLRSRFGIDGRTVYVQEPVLADEQKISSSEIRRNLLAGQPAEAAKLLGEYYSVQGLVQRGDARGRLLGFPTLNIKLPDKCLPLEGVYAGWIDHEGERLAAVANLGGQPTFGEGERPRLEVHVLDAQLPELYGTEVRFHFLERLRGLVRFEGPKALSAQLSLDTENARRCCSGAVPLVVD